MSEGDWKYFRGKLMGFYDRMAIEVERRKARNSFKAFRLVCGTDAISLLLETHPDPFGIHLYTLKVLPGIPTTLCSFV